MYGTPFEELEDEERDAVKKKPKSIQEEVVTDEKGRRRFHGAFTGGFSAGYFNTVGSKHGWVPQTFKSSRNSRAEETKFGVEDFMDDEDFGEFGIAAKRIRTKSDFVDVPTLFGGEKGQLAWERSIFPQNSSKDTLSMSITSSLIGILKPINDSIGIRLMKKMGWRAGKGIGPSMSRRALERQKMIDASSTDTTHKFDETAVDEIEEIAPNAEFAPDDIREFEFVSKENTHGLGYVPLKDAGVLEQNYGVISSGLKLSRKGKAIRGQAFGVGAFEDDDDDVYTTYDLSQYDFEVGASTSTSANKESARFDLTFVPAKKPFGNARKFFEAPRPPASYRPIIKLMPMKVKNLPEKVLKVGERLTPLERARFLGDRTNSIMELLSDKDRKFLKQIQKTNESTKSTRMAEEKKKSFTEPFEEEPMKSHRFKQFVHYLKRGIDFPQPIELTRLEWEKELSDFKGALTPELRALLPEVSSRQKPLARVEFSQPIAEQLKLRFQKESGSEYTDRREKVSKDHDRIQAVRMKMFGEKTRIRYQWYPSKELCKRFNVPNPHPESSIVGVPELQKKSKYSANVMDFTVVGNSGLGLPNTANDLAFQRETRMNEKNTVGSKIVDDDFLNWDDVESTPSNRRERMERAVVKNEEAENNAPWELLQALFQESSSESEPDSDSDLTNNEGTSDNLTKEKDPEVVNVDEPLVAEDEPVIIDKVITVLDLVEDDDVYGPKLPPLKSVSNSDEEHENVPLTFHSQKTEFCAADYKDEAKHKKMKKHKKKGNKKHQKKETKRHKKSKKKRSRSTDSSTSGSSIEIIS